MVTTNDRHTRRIAPFRLAVGIAGDQDIPLQTMVGINEDGFMVQATADSDLRMIGMFVGTAHHKLRGTTTGLADGAVIGEMEFQCYDWDNSAGGDEITADMRGQLCYEASNDTVAATSNGGARPPAGYVWDVDTERGRVWVYHLPVAVAGGLLAANNLSEVASPATARGNLGIREQIVITGRPLNSDNTIRFVWSGPDNAVIQNIRTVVEGATTTAAQDCTIQAQIAGVDVTDGLVTIAGGSAIGTVDIATPTALNVVDAGQVISLVVSDGSQVAVATANVTIEFSY